MTKGNIVVIYMYRTNQTMQSCSTKGFIKHKRDHAKVTLRLCRFLSKNYDEMPDSMIKSSDKFVRNMIIQQYKIFLIENPLSNCNRKNIIKFDQILKQNNIKLYKETEKENFILRLRQSQFKGWVIQKILFWIQLKLGLIEGLYN